MALGVASWAGPSRADPEQDYELAKSRFEGALYEEAVQLFSRLLAPPIEASDPNADQKRQLYRRARPYYTATLVALGRVEAADTVILDQLLDDPFYELPPGVFHTAVSDRFIAVAGAHRPEIELRKKEILRRRQRDIEALDTLRKLREARVLELEKMAAEEKVTERRSRFVASLPFGAGQFQNGSVGLGAFFAVSEVAPLISTMATAGVYFERKDLFRRSCRRDEAGNLVAVSRVDTANENQDLDCEGLSSQLDALRAATWITFGSALALGVAGIIEAHVSFQSEVVTIKKRPIPPHIDAPPVIIKPTGGPIDGGFLLGMLGSF